jgi:hypothetical protein
MKWLSHRVVLNVAGAILALVAIAWILLGSSVTANTPIVHIGTWAPLPAAGHAR